MLRSRVDHVCQWRASSRPAGRNQERRADLDRQDLGHARRADRPRLLRRAAPLVTVALTGRARLTATMSVRPWPCVSRRCHGQIDVTLGRLIQLGTIDAMLAAFLSAAVKSRCNIIVAGWVNAGKPANIQVLTALLPAVMDQ